MMPKYEKHVAEITLIIIRMMMRMAVNEYQYQEISANGTAGTSAVRQ